MGALLQLSSHRSLYNQASSFRRMRDGPVRKYSGSGGRDKPYMTRNENKTVVTTRNGAPRRGGQSGARVYVGNLSYATTWQTLKDHMRQAGNVIHADVLMESSGRSKGCGLVEYSTAKEAANAIAQLNDTHLDDRQIFVREDREEGKAGVSAGASNSKSEGTGGRMIYVSNLPYGFSWQDLKDTFRHAGNVVRADVALDQNGRSKGTGTVVYSSADEANAAITMFDKAQFDGRTVGVRIWRD